MQTFRPRSARVTAVAIVVVAAALGTAQIVKDGIAASVPTVGIAALAISGAVAAYWRPAVVVSSDAVELRNITSRVTIPLSRLAHVDTRWALELTSDEGRKYSAFAAPAPGAFAARTMKPEDGRGLPKVSYVGGTIRPGDRPGSPSGDAALLVRRAWEEHGQRHSASGDRVTVRPDGAGIAIVAAGIAALALSLVV